MSAPEAHAAEAAAGADAASSQEFGVWLREQRLAPARGWSKTEMARRIHAMMTARGGKVPAVPSIARSLDGWEGGGRYPRDRWQAMLCQVLGIGLEDLPAVPRLVTFPATLADLDPDDPRPWVQVVCTLLQEIQAGKLKARDPMPRLADVAGQAGVSVTTVRRSYRYLQVQEVIRFWPGAGYYVSGQQPDGQRHEVPGPGDDRVPGAVRPDDPAQAEAR